MKRVGSVRAASENTIIQVNKMPTRSRDATLGTNAPRCLHASILSTTRRRRRSAGPFNSSNLHQIESEPTAVFNRPVGIVGAEEHLGRLAGLFLRRRQEKVGPGMLSQHGVEPLEFAVHFDDDHPRRLIAANVQVKKDVIIVGERTKRTNPRLVIHRPQDVLPRATSEP